MTSILRFGRIATILIISALLVSFVSSIACSESAPLLTHESKRFKLNTEFDNPEWSTYTLNLLEDYLTWIEKETGNKWPKNEKIEANIYSTSARYIEDDKKRSGGGYAGVWAYNLGNAVNVIHQPRFDDLYLKLVGRSPICDSLMLHETTHALDLKTIPQGNFFPGWMCEGRAEYYSRTYRGLKGLPIQDDIWYARYLAAIRDTIAATGKLPFTVKDVLGRQDNPSYGYVFTMYSVLKADKALQPILKELEHQQFTAGYSERRVKASPGYEKLLKKLDYFEKAILTFIEQSPDCWSEQSVSAWGQNGKFRLSTFPGVSCVMIHRTPGKDGFSLQCKLHIHPYLTQQTSVVFGHQTSEDYYQLSFTNGAFVELQHRKDGAWDVGHHVDFGAAGIKWEKDGDNELVLLFTAASVKATINGTGVTLTLKDSWKLPEKWRWGVSTWDSYADFSEFKIN
ncbi:MAG: hypothetical protein WC712_08360 [Candidatus Brocadiia bacterium]